MDSEPLRLNYFNPEQDPLLYRCACGDCDARPTPQLLLFLDKARHYARIPFIITSGPRCHDHNIEVGGSKTSEHITGQAADVRAQTSRERFFIVDAALKTGFERIGIGRDFIHLGLSPNHDSQVIWLY